MEEPDRPAYPSQPASTECRGGRLEPLPALVDGHPANPLRICQAAETHHDPSTDAEDSDAARARLSGRSGGEGTSNRDERGGQLLDRSALLPRPVSHLLC